MKTLLLGILTCHASLVLTACGSQPLYDDRQTKIAGLDARPTSEVYLAFQLPDRNSFSNDSPTTASQIDSYYFRFAGEGADCPTTSQQHEEFGAYEDKKLVGAKVLDSCDFRIIIKLGSRANSPVALKLKPNDYPAQIKDTLHKSCVSCHSEFKNYASAQARATQIASAIENRSMPPDQALDDSQVAMFLAWADGGFREEEQQPNQTYEQEQKLEKIYYRNNNDDLLKAYELYGVITKDLRRSLWLQDDGLAAKISTRQLYTFTPTSAKN